MTPAQTVLVHVSPQPIGLTEHQQTAWDLVRSVPGGCFADEVGAAVHAAAGRHSVDERCDWCCVRGKQLLGSKALAALVIRRRATSKWEPRNPKDRAREPMGEIPW